MPYDYVAKVRSHGGVIHATRISGLAGKITRSIVMPASSANMVELLDITLAEAIHTCQLHRARHAECDDVSGINEPDRRASIKLLRIAQGLHVQ